jgi:hypothetical protein
MAKCSFGPPFSSKGYAVVVVAEGAGEELFTGEEGWSGTSSGFSVSISPQIGCSCLRDFLEWKVSTFWGREDFPCATSRHFGPSARKAKIGELIDDVTRFP